MVRFQRRRIISEEGYFFLLRGGWRISRSSFVTDIFVTDSNLKQFIPVSFSFLG